MKKIIFLLTFVGIFCLASSSWAGLTATVADVSTNAGKPVDVKVTFSSNSKSIGALETQLEYDPSIFQLTGVDNGATTKGFTLVFNESRPGFVEVASASATLFKSSSGELLIFHFTARPAVKKAKYSFKSAKVTLESVTSTYSATIKSKGSITIK